MEQGHEVKAPAPAEAWDPAVEVVVEAAVMEPARAETVFVQTVNSRFRNKLELLVEAESAPDAEPP